MEIIEYDDIYYDGVNTILMEAFNVSKSKISDSNAHEFVALLDDKVVGYLILSEMVDIIKNIKTLHVDYVCVSSNVRGQGIGKKMMEYAEKFAKENGCSRMELTSGNQRIAAHKLYLSIGFIKRDTTVFRKELV